MKTVTQNPEKQRILDAAEERFRLHGFQHVSVDELAAQLGMSKKTIYKHFASKDELMTEIIRYSQRYIAQHMHAILSADAPSVEKLARMLSFIGSQYARLSSILRSDLMRYRPDLWKEVEAFRRQLATREIYPTLQQAKAEGVLNEDVNPHLLFLILLSMIEGILNPQTMAQQPFSIQQAFAGIFHVLFQGALTPEAAARLKANVSSEFLSDLPRVL